MYPLHPATLLPVTANPRVEEQTPAQGAQIRIETSKALLENTNLRVDEILDRVGYNDDSTFRRLFKKHTTLSPHEYRRRFGLKN